jgi:hypothetical protein
VALLGVAHACRWPEHNGHSHACVCGVTWEPRELGCTTAPVTAEDLRTRLIAKVRTVYDESCATFAVDTVLAELAGDPGDLPPRMADAIDFATCKHIARDDESACGECRAAAAMSVRWVHAAHLEAENEYRLRRDEYLKAAIDRVRALHSPEEDPRRVRDCKGCRTVATFTPYEECRTLAALAPPETTPDAPTGETDHG